MTELSRRHVLAGAAAASAATVLTPFATSRASAAAPLAGKQNPGWYRYRVGSIEMTVVTDGRNNNPLPDTYAANAKKDEINAVLEANRYPKDRAVQSYTPVVVNTGTKLVAIDEDHGHGQTLLVSGVRRPSDRPSDVRPRSSRVPAISRV